MSTTANIDLSELMVIGIDIVRHHINWDKLPVERVTLFLFEWEVFMPWKESSVRKTLCIQIRPENKKGPAIRPPSRRDKIKQDHGTTAGSAISAALLQKVQMIWIAVDPAMVLKSASIHSSKQMFVASTAAIAAITNNGTVSPKSVRCL